MNPAPDDHDRQGAIPREPECHACGCPHHILSCDRCDCPTDYAPGIY